MYVYQDYSRQGSPSYFWYNKQANQWIAFDPHDLVDPDEVRDVALTAVYTAGAGVSLGLLAEAPLGAFIAREIGEAIAEEITGIPWIATPFTIDPTDVFDPLINRGVKKLLGISEGAATQGMREGAEQVGKEGLKRVSKEGAEEVGKEVSEKGFKQAAKHPNWVEVQDIRAKIVSRKKHVLEIEGIKSKGGKKGFTGCHSKGALDDYVARNPGSTYVLKNKDLDISSGVYKADPVIKSASGEEFVKLNNKGQSTFFPDQWDEAKVLDEVEHAIQNNHGRNFSGAPNEYYGFSSDGKVEIHFYLNPQGGVNSYFPVLK